MSKVYELYDKITGETLGYHKTIAGAVKAASEKMAKLAAPLQRDFDGDGKVELTLSFTITSHELKE